MRCVYRPWGPHRIGVAKAWIMIADHGVHDVWETDLYRPDWPDVAKLEAYCKTRKELHGYHWPNQIRLLRLYSE